MNADLATTIRNVHDLATRADQIAHGIEAHRVRRESGGPGFASSIERPHKTNSKVAANGASVMAIFQLGVACRDLHSIYATAFAALPDDLQKAIAAN
jgi:hypothetical protein